jgi:hypothetical protein
MSGGVHLDPCGKRGASPEERRRCGPETDNWEESFRRETVYGRRDAVWNRRE